MNKQGLLQQRWEGQADILQDALEYVRAMLAQGRTVGQDWQQAALDAEDFILALLYGFGELPEGWRQGHEPS